MVCLRSRSVDKGLVLVDSGAPKIAGDQAASSCDQRHVALGGDARVQVLFNTHYHVDQTGNNEMFAAAGAKIIAHEHTRQWMSTDYWVPDEDRYEKARPKAARPTETFQTTGSFESGSPKRSTMATCLWPTRTATSMSFSRLRMFSL